MQSHPLRQMLAVRITVSSKIAPVMNQPDVFGVQVLPRPVEPRQLTEKRVLLRDVCSRIIAGITKRRRFHALLLDAGSHLQGKIQGILRHPVFLVCGHNDFRTVFFFCLHR